METNVLLQFILATVLLILVAVSALSFRLFFRKKGKIYHVSYETDLAAESQSGGGCGCGGCGCGGGNGK